MASAGVFITVLERLTQEVGPINVQAYMLMSFLWLPTFLKVDIIGPKNNFWIFGGDTFTCFPFLTLFWTVGSLASYQLPATSSGVTVMQSGKPLKSSGCADRETEAQRVARVQTRSP